ncbi:precorrin-3B synthase [Amycolatopsis pigmentata]|uniref:Precorrin-3B synthase n=1 Tax=Amycolatopsis pigmentata TaxID=450801 RepID=A0ABW5FXK8_9PSEU
MVLRARADACPGVFAPHDAADGAVARVRLPGGRITGSALRAVAGCAEDLGDGSVHLTSRGNVQLRGLDRNDDAVVDALVARLSAVGLLPAPEHERARNFLASPLSGLAGGLVDVGPLARELDVAVCARPEAARLPGRFLFALDDGRGDVSDEDPDICWRAVSSATGALLLAGQDTGLRIPFPEAVSALVAVALRFLEVRGAAWRVRELSDPAVVLDCLGGAPGTAAGTARAGSGGPCPLGEFARDDGGTGMVVAPVLGECTAGQLRAVADLLADATAPATTAPAVAVITPWRSIVLPRKGDLAGTGLLAGPAEPAAGVSACIGRPGCAKSRADVRANARSLIEVLPAGVRVHFSGCERRCGRPHGPHLDVVARKEEL